METSRPPRRPSRSRHDFGRQRSCGPAPEAEPGAVREMRSKGGRVEAEGATRPRTGNRRPSPARFGAALPRPHPNPDVVVNEIRIEIDRQATVTLEPPAQDS